MGLPALPTMLAVATTVLLFSVFLWAREIPVLEAGALIYQGAFGSTFSWENTLLRAAPLMLTALCVALPARAGLIIIGGEGALVLGGLAAAVTPLASATASTASAAAPALSALAARAASDSIACVKYLQRAAHFFSGLQV